MSFDKARTIEEAVKTREAAETAAEEAADAKKKAEEAVAAATALAGMSQAQMQMFLDLQQRMLAIQEQQAQSLNVQVERTSPKDNPNYHNISVYNPKGLPETEREQLKCIIFLGPFRLNRTPLSEDEVHALNQLEPVKGARIEKTDGSIVLVDVVPTFDSMGELRRLEIVADLKKDKSPQAFPPLLNLARQLVAAAQAKKEAKEAAAA